MKKSVIGAIIVILAALFAGAAYSQQLPIVTAIEVKGLKRIEEGSIRAKVSQKLKEPLSHEKTAEDIKVIYKMGYFDDVRVDIAPFEGGIKVVYIVREKPTIIRVEFQGNKEFKDDDLKEKISLISGAISDVALINDNATKLKLFYEDEGYYLAKVVPILKKIDEGEVSVTYQIEEGKKVKIKEIKIEGNKALSEKKIKNAMKTAERKFYSFIMGGGYYKKEEIRADIDKIRDLYYNNGYLKIAVGEPKVQLTEDKEGMRITIQVSEGEQFKVSSVGIAGNKAFTEEEIRRLIKLSPNKIFNKEILKKDTIAISDLYSNNGYALVSVAPDLTPDEQKKETGVIYRIEEGDKYKIGRIQISGNTKTMDKVVRREIRLDEGDIFNASALKRSYERINNLNYFESVEVSPKPKAEEKLVDLDVKVKDKETGFLSIGGGYSSVDNLIGMVDLTQANLFGTGRYIKAKGEMGGRSSFFELSYRDPWFLDYPVSFGASIYRTTRNHGNYKRKATGFELSLGKSFWEYWGANVAYNLENSTVYDVKSDASQSVKDQAGTKTTSSISTTVARDTRDNYLDPSSGSRNALYVTFAGLGGSNAFIREVFDSGWYFPVFEVTTFHVRGRVGHASGLFGKHLPIYEKFYVGGIYTVRGLAHGAGGPKDLNGEALGGDKEIIFNAEYIFPILTEQKFKGLVFFDSGRAYGAGETFGSDLRYTSGAGIRWISPMGPIRVEWGYNLSKKAGESSSKFEFTFGSSF
jgi:outer membrane protein insertion porin family